MELASEPVVSADGQAFLIKGKCELEISLSGITVVHLLLVAVDVTQDCLLEINFLGKQNCTIDLKGKHSKLAKGLWVSRKKMSFAVFCISVAETVVVLGHHEMVLPAEFKGALCGFV